MKISIGICTKDNLVLLKKCLTRLLEQKAPSKVRVYVIDSSKDSEEIKTLLKNIFKETRKFDYQYVFEPKKGISHARNTLFSLVKEGLLFTIDDDVLVSKEWLINGLNFFSKNRSAGIVGGKITLYQKLPKHVADLLNELDFKVNIWPLTIFNLGSKVKKLTNFEHYPLFANMGIRVKILRKIRLSEGFANQEGLIKVYGGEDPDFIEQARKITSVYYSPRMSALHFIKNFKFSYLYFYWRFWENGKEQALLQIKHQLPSRYSFKDVYYTLTNFFKSRSFNSLNATAITLVFYLSFFTNRKLYSFLWEKK